jgi:hypothetical protein
MDHPKCLTISSIEGDPSEAHYTKGDIIEEKFVEGNLTKPHSTKVDLTKELWHLWLEEMEIIT